MVVARGRLSIEWVQISLGEDEKVLKVAGGDSCTVM